MAPMASPAPEEAKLLQHGEGANSAAGDEEAATDGGVAAHASGLRWTAFRGRAAAGVAMLLATALLACWALQPGPSAAGSGLQQVDGAAFLDRSEEAPASAAPDPGALSSRTLDLVSAVATKKRPLGKQLKSPEEGQPGVFGLLKQGIKSVWSRWHKKPAHSSPTKAVPTPRPTSSWTRRRRTVQASTSAAPESPATSKAGPGAADKSLANSEAGPGAADKSLANSEETSEDEEGGFQEQLAEMLPALGSEALSQLANSGTEEEAEEIAEAEEAEPGDSAEKEAKAREACRHLAEQVTLDEDLERLCGHFLRSEPEEVHMQ